MFETSKLQYKEGTWTRFLQTLFVMGFVLFLGVVGVSQGDVSLAPQNGLFTFRAEVRWLRNSYGEEKEGCTPEGSHWPSALSRWDSHPHKATVTVGDLRVLSIPGFYEEAAVECFTVLGEDRTWRPWVSASNSELGEGPKRTTDHL